MAKTSDIFGISKLEIGEPGDGVMGSSLQEYGSIREATGTLSLPKGETIKIFSEQKRNAPYRIINAGSSDAKMFSFNLLGVDLSEWADLLGGSYDTATKKWSGSNSLENVYKSVRITTKTTDEDGSYMVFEIPYALLSGGIDNAALTYNDLTDLSFTAEAMIPTSDAGAEGSDMTVQLVDDTYLQTFDIDDATGALEFAIVIVGGQTLITDSSGLATINLADGSYAYTVDATGYTQSTGTLVVSSAAATESVTLVAS